MHDFNSPEMKRLFVAIKINPDKKFLFGKVTMYPQFNREARNLILYFLNKHFGDTKNMLIPIEPIKKDWDEDEMKKLFDSGSYHENYKALSKKVRSYKETIPPLINAYMNLSPSMKTFGTTVNKEFGSVEETGIMITIADLYQDKIGRHVSTYQRVKFYLKADKLF